MYVHTLADIQQHDVPSKSSGFEDICSPRRPRDVVSQLQRARPKSPVLRRKIATALEAPVGMPHPKSVLSSHSPSGPASRGSNTDALAAWLEGVQIEENAGQAGYAETACPWWRAYGIETLARRRSESGGGVSPASSAGSRDAEGARPVCLHRWRGGAYRVVPRSDYYGAQGSS